MIGALKKIIKNLKLLVFISDHPLNQFKEIYDDYKIEDFQTFNSQGWVKTNKHCCNFIKCEEKLLKVILMLFLS